MYNRVSFQACFLYSSSTTAFSFKTTGLLIKADMKWPTPNKVLIRQSLKKLAWLVSGLLRVTAVTGGVMDTE